MLLAAIAPWIMDSWHEVLAGLSFELPVVPLDTYQFHVALTLTGLVLLALGWRMVGPMPARARFAALSLLTLAMLAPLAILTSHHLDELSRLPEFAGRIRKAFPGEAPSDIDLQPAQSHAALPVPAASAAPETQAAAPQPPPSQPTRESAPEAVSLPPRSPPHPVSDSIPAPVEAANATARKVLRQLTKLVPSSTNAGLMPIFYGTDRRATEGTGRPGYTAGHAARLEIGQAFIQVPPGRLVKPTNHPWTAAQAQIESFGGIQTAPSTSSNQLTIAGLKPLSHDDFLQQTVMRLATSHRDKDHALIFVPGHNTSFDAALYRAAQIAYDLRFDGAPFVYSWPSDGATANYRHDTESVAKATAYFADFVRLVAEGTGAKTISFVAHGLGGRLTLDVLTSLKDKLPAGVSVRELVLTTPDIDAAAFKSRMASVSSFASRITLYVDSADRGLNISRRYTGGVPRAGDVPTGGPLVIPGVETVDVSVCGTQAVGLNHPDYVTGAALLGHIASRLRDEPGPSAALETIPTPAGPYLRLR